MLAIQQRMHLLSAAWVCQLRFNVLLVSLWVQRQQHIIDSCSLGVNAPAGSAPHVTLHSWNPSTQFNSSTHIKYLTPLLTSKDRYFFSVSGSCGSVTLHRPLFQRRGLHTLHLIRIRTIPGSNTCLVGLRSPTTLALHSFKAPWQAFWSPTFDCSWLPSKYGAIFKKGHH